jgi:hypothetical protein
MTQSEVAFEACVAALATRGFEADIDRAEPAKPVAQLEVVAHVDDQGRPYIARGTFLNDLSEAVSGADAEGDPVYLQLVCILPFELSGPDRLADVGGLLFMLNRLMPLTQFGLSEVDGLVFLRAVLTSETRAVPPRMVCEAIGMMQVFLEAWGDPIERLAGGRASLDEIVGELQATGFTAPGLFPEAGDG